MQMIMNFRNSMRMPKEIFQTRNICREETRDFFRVIYGAKKKQVVGRVVKKSDIEGECAESNVSFLCFLLLERV